MKRRFQWESFTIWPLIFSIGLFLRHEVSVNQETAMDYSWLVVSSVFFWFSISMILFHQGLRYNLERVDDWKWTVFGTSSVAAANLAAGISFLVLILPVLKMFGLPAYTQKILIGLMFYSFAYFFLCLIFMWSRCHAREDCLVVIDKKIFYPGEEFWILPFVNYDIGEIKKQTIFIFDTELNCQDGHFQVMANGRATVVIEEAMYDEVRSCDASVFMDKLHREIEAVLDSASRTMTIAEVTERNFKAKEFKIFGLLVLWNGSINIVPLSNCAEEKGR